MTQRRRVAAHFRSVERLLVANMYFVELSLARVRPSERKGVIESLRALHLITDEVATAATEALVTRGAKPYRSNWFKRIFTRPKLPQSARSGFGEALLGWAKRIDAKAAARGGEVSDEDIYEMARQNSAIMAAQKVTVKHLLGLVELARSSGAS